MKIVIAITNSFSANFIAGQARFLKTKGNEVVIVSADGDEVRRVAEADSAKLVIIPFVREISVWSDLKCLMKIIKFIKDEKPDLINAGNPKTGFLFMIAGILFPDIKKVYTLRGLRSETLTGFKKRVVKFTEYISCRLANKVIVISPSLNQRAIELGLLSSESGIVIGKGSSNGVDVNIFDYRKCDESRRSLFRASIGIHKPCFIIGYVGRVTKDKGVEELVNSFSVVERLKPDVKLVIVGPIEKDDPISSSIMALMTENPNILLLGKKNNLEEIYPGLDVLILYSYREGFGNVAIEASAMGVPTIVSDIPGARDTTEHMKSGILVPPNCVEELTSAILFYINNPDIKSEHGDYGSKRVNNHFSSEMIWQGQYDLYKHLKSQTNQ